MKITQVMTGHQDLVSGISFLRSDFLVSGGADRVIKVWDVQKGKTMNSVFSRSICRSLDVSQYSGSIASGHQDGKLRLWSASGLNNGSSSIKSTVTMTKEFGEIHDDSITSVLF